MTLAIDSRKPATNNLIPSEHEMMVFHTMAEQAVNSKMYRGVGDKAGVMMVMLAAREVGIPPMAALNGGINIIQGKIEISALMMSAMIRREGHSLQTIESTDVKCVLKGIRRDNGDTATVSYTIEDAKLAGLVKGNGGWTKNPKDLCFARCVSRIRRQLFSDVGGMSYAEGEISHAEPRDLERIASPERPLSLDDDNDFAALGLSPKPEEDLPEEKMVEIFINSVEKGDRMLAIEYIQAVMEHFSWDRKRALKELTSYMESTLPKFEVWKARKSQ